MKMMAVLVRGGERIPPHLLSPGGDPAPPWLLEADGTWSHGSGVTLTAHQPEGTRHGSLSLPCHCRLTKRIVSFVLSGSCSVLQEISRIVLGCLEAEPPQGHRGRTVDGT
ncbi:hypothetical protein IRJ41_019836 [Triplophysa rosa]|uniref:Uncharacterized protein n=1 Tax=Triplophysa rosa TaxID=992332 RepID=A0A9W7WXB9_TRIRA|nr:hypothetical protein IRJ41_019836 [Triplophysa rosa]